MPVQTKAELTQAANACETELNEVQARLNDLHASSNGFAGAPEHDELKERQNYLAEQIRRLRKMAEDAG